MISGACSGVLLRKLDAGLRYGPAQVLFGVPGGGTDVGQEVLHPGDVVPKELAVKVAGVPVQQDTRPGPTGPRSPAGLPAVVPGVRPGLVRLSPAMEKNLAKWDAGKLMTDTSSTSMGGASSTNPEAAPAGASGEQARQVAEAAREKEWAKPSFGKELFLGRLRLDLVHPHPRPSAEQVAKGEEFLAKLEGFLRADVDPLEIEHDAKIPDHVLKGLSDIGALGMKIDEKYGGLGLSHLYYIRALALAGTASGAISTLLSAHQSIGAPQPLKLFGTEEQKQKFLPRAGQGRSQRLPADRARRGQ